MTDRNHIIKRILLVAVTALILVIALPQSWRSWTPWFLSSPTFHFGIDLAGGTQLDFRISEDEIAQQLQRVETELAALPAGPDHAVQRDTLTLERSVLQEQRANLVEAIRTVLERRINALGVSEATITPSFMGDEKHLLVECPGVIDVQQCIATVGKTIQLEFKEEFTEATDDFQRQVRAAVDAIQARLTAGETLQTVGQDMNDELGISYVEERPYFTSELPQGLERLVQRTPSAGVLRVEGSVKGSKTDEQGNPIEVDVPGVFLAEVTRPAGETMERTLNRADEALPLLAEQEPDLTYVQHTDVALSASVPAPIAAALRSMKLGDLRSVKLDEGSARVLFLRKFVPGGETVQASHILVSYAGATQAEASVKRTKEEALRRAQELKAQLAGGANFASLARRESDGPSKANGGSLGAFGRGAMVPAFEQAAFSLPVGSVSDPIETPFGFHLIHVDAAPSTSPDVASYEELVVPGQNADVRGNGLIGRLQGGLVKRSEPVTYARVLFFSLEPTGWKDTALDGKHFRSAIATQDPTSLFPIVQIMFDAEGGKLFQELTKNNVGKRIAIFVGGELVSAPVVQQEISGGSAVITGSQDFAEAQRLATDLNTGAIPAPIHLVGQRTVEATLGAEALRTSMLAGVLGIVIVMLYMLVMYRVLGVLADLSLLAYAAIFLALLQLPLLLVTDTYIVLTLAGAAGLILSIGMAVDTNVLIFERIKEELQRGKSLKSALELGFEKSWPSIRDSNVSTLITCLLLFTFGTSIVRGFAVTLGLGVVISMFTGITVTRWLCRWLASSQWGKRENLFRFGKA
jgi:protein-export membrane protein SecD